MLKYPLKRQLQYAKCHRLNIVKCYANTNSEYTIEYTKHVKDTYLLEQKSPNNFIQTANIQNQ